MVGQSGRQVGDLKDHPDGPELATRPHVLQHPLGHGGCVNKWGVATAETHARFCTCAIGGSTMGTRVKSLVLRTLKWLLKADFVVSSGKMAR